MNLKDLQIIELLQLQAAVTDVLKARKVVRTHISSNPKQLAVPA